MRQQLTQDLDVIISSAAAVKFNDSLLGTINANYFGSLRLLDLAHACKHDVVFNHISTAYCNSNLPDGTRIFEKVYPFLNIDRDKDVEELVADLHRMDPARLQEGTKNKSLLDGFVDCYPFSK